MNIERIIDENENNVIWRYLNGHKHIYSPGCLGVKHINYKIWKHNIYGTAQMGCVESSFLEQQMTVSEQQDFIYSCIDASYYHYKNTATKEQFKKINPTDDIKILSVVGNLITLN